MMIDERQPMRFAVVVFRTSVGKVGLVKVAAKIREHNFQALLIIGGYEVSETISTDQQIIVDVRQSVGVLFGSANV